MRLDLGYLGQRKTILLLVLDGGTCLSREYLQALENRDRISHQAMVRRYVDHANIGSTRIGSHGHPIVRRNNLFVWKTKQGARLLYFNLPNNKVVVTIGYNKGDPEKQQYDRAENLRDAWLQQEGGRER